LLRRQFGRQEIIYPFHRRNVQGVDFWRKTFMGSHVERLLLNIKRHTNQSVYDALMNECGTLGEEPPSVELERYRISVFEKMQLLCSNDETSKILHADSFYTLGELRKVYGFNDFLSKYSDNTEIRGFSGNENRLSFILGGELFVKIYPNKGSSYFLDGTHDKEVGVYEYIQKNNIPIHVPQMICNGANDGYPYIALEYIRGRTMRQPRQKGNNAEEKQIISSAAGELMNVLHSIRKNDELHGVVERNHLKDIQSFSQRLGEVDNNAELMNRAFEKISEFLLKHDEEKVLVQGDAHINNFLIDDSGQVYLYDFETAFWGDPNYDIAGLTKKGHIKFDDFVDSGGYKHPINREAVKAYQMMYCVTVMAYYCPHYKQRYGFACNDAYLPYKNRLVECLRQ